jgi:hypothetical protein
MGGRASKLLSSALDILGVLGGLAALRAEHIGPPKATMPMVSTSGFASVRSWMDGVSSTR